MHPHRTLCFDTVHIGSNQKCNQTSNQTQEQTQEQAIKPVEATGCIASQIFQSF